MEKENGVSKEYVTPTSYVIGWLFLTFGSIPLFVAIADRNKGALFIGVGAMIGAVVCFAIGKYQNKKFFQKFTGQKKP